MKMQLAGFVAFTLLLTGCDDDPGGAGDADVATDADTVHDADQDDADPDADSDSDSAPPLEFSLGLPIFEPPTDPLVGAGVESCSVYRQRACVSGRQRQCDVYDVSAASFVDAPDPLVRRAYNYDRWYDLFMSPDGQTADRDFTRAMEPGAPEREWTDRANFARWVGAGDSGIWTGTALNAYILRYLETGTEADYQRMEGKVRVLLGLFEVTGIPGYLARYHFLHIEDPAGPNTPDHIVRHGPVTTHRAHLIENPEAIDVLPDAYFSGITAPDGTVHRGTPMWNGAPSIDQMNGPMVALPMAYGLLRDEGLRAQITRHMTCYLKRLQRIELINLQSNPEILAAVQAFFTGPHLNLDEDDIDFMELDRVVMYVNAQYNELNATTYDRSCPDSIQMTPTRVLDATDADFIFDVLSLVMDLGGLDELRENGIDHFYVPNVRGGDAMHMMHLAAMAHAFTGEQMYADFLRDELLGELRTAEVAMAMGAIQPNDWCRAFYGTNITVGPLWAFINLLEPSPLRIHMQRVMRVEAWEKESFDLGNVNFNLMFAGVVPDSMGGAGRQEALDYALEHLPLFGGNGGVLDDPRRTYALSYEQVAAAMPSDIEPVCPTEEQRAACEEGFVVFGIPVEGQPITRPCTGASNECPMSDGLCARAIASGPLPPMLRPWADYLWQRSPYTMGEDRTHGLRQSPGIDLMEEFWMARFYDFVSAGEGQVLAWRDIGGCD